MKTLLTLLACVACLAAAATSVDAKTKARAKADQRTVLTAFTYADRAALLYEIPSASTYHTDDDSKETSTVLPGGRIEFLCETSPDKGSLKDAAEDWFERLNNEPRLTAVASEASVSGHAGGYFTSMASVNYVGADKTSQTVQLKALAVHGEQNRVVVCGAVISQKATKAQLAVLDRVFKSFVLKAPYPAP